MKTLGPDPDTPDPADRTMQRLETATALDEVFPQWRSYVGESQRDGVPLGWVAADTAPAGAMPAELGEDEQAPEAVPLSWEAGQTYLVLRTPEAPEVWVRAYPVTYNAEAMLFTREIEPDRGTRRWQLLTAEENPVLLTDTATRGRPRPWLLREDASYDLEHDIEGGWQVFGHDTPGGTVPRPGT